MGLKITLKSLWFHSISEPEQLASKELKGVAEEDALRKLLSSGEEDEEEEEEVQQILSYCSYEYSQVIFSLLKILCLSQQRNSQGILNCNKLKQ
jgi:hypothetical protein